MDMMQSLLGPWRTEQEVPCPDLNDPSLIAVAVPVMMASARSCPSSVSLI